MKQTRFLLGLLMLLIGSLKNADFVSADDVPVLEDAHVDAYGRVSLSEAVKEAVDSKNEEIVTNNNEKKIETIIAEETEIVLDVSTEKVEIDEAPDASVKTVEESVTADKISSEDIIMESVLSEDSPYIEPEEIPSPTESVPSKTPFSLASSKASLAFLKNKLTVAVEKVKGLTPAEVKKAAAGALGVWGAAVGIRFALQRGD